MNAKNVKIAIFGAGAMGTVLGALLIKGGLQNVDLITRNKSHVNGLRSKGAVLHYAEGDTEEIPVKALTPQEMTEPYDVIFLMTKQRNNVETVQFLLPYLKTDGVLCTTQNGLPEGSIAPIIGNARMYGAATTFGAEFIGNGEVVLTSKKSGMSMEIGGYQNDGSKLPILMKILAYVGKAIGKEDFAKPTENLWGARWSKLSINAAFSGLSVVTGLTFGKIAQKHKTRKLALCVLRECLAVAKAAGVTVAKMQGHDMEKFLGGNTPIKRFIAYLVLPFAMKKHKKLLSGMLKDVEKGKRCEIDFINGVVVKEGERYGVATPYCKQIVEIVHGIENGLYEITDKNVDFFFAMEE
ncbi:MAG: 2-dehydropantoate 2-reductase [Clostridia bacterium]|nr:2-dehydropantoate 2-reductase [Clostridia bacterium]